MKRVIQFSLFICVIAKLEEDSSYSTICPNTTKHSDNFYPNSFPIFKFFTEFGIPIYPILGVVGAQK